MKKVVFITNIPSPYRMNFFNELGKKVDLTVVFEAERNYSLNENWYTGTAKNFKAIFLKKGSIEEHRINFKILKWIKHHQDILIFSNYSYFTEMVGLIWAKLFRIPYWMELDGAIIKTESKLKYRWKSFLIKGAQKYMSTSKNTDEFLVHYGVPKSKIERYPFSSLRQVDIIKEPLSLSAKQRLREELDVREPRVIVSVGQFIYRKGFDVLMQAARSLPSDFGIYIVGGKPTPEYLEMKEKWNLTQVHFVEFKNTEELKKYYKMADLFVMPTREDVWGLVVNEAMGNGLPVLSTNHCVAGLELIRENINGYIVPVEDSHAISEKIKLFFSNQEMQEKMAEEALKTISNYTIENMAKTHEEIIKRN